MGLSVGGKGCCLTVHLNSGGKGYTLVSLSVSGKGCSIAVALNVSGKVYTLVSLDGVVLVVVLLLVWMLQLGVVVLL